MNEEDGEETEAPGTNEDNKDERSPTKKRGGSSKTSTKKNGGLRQVSPQEQGTTASKEKTTTFADEFMYPYSRIILELAITLKSNKAFEEYTQALMAFITNVQIVDPKFIINRLKPRSDTKPITMKGEISPNMTKLSTHIKISQTEAVRSVSRKCGIEEKMTRTTVEKTARPTRRRMSITTQWYSF
jgi:hypothetical protein